MLRVSLGISFHNQKNLKNICAVKWLRIYLQSNGCVKWT